MSTQSHSGPAPRAGPPGGRAGLLDAELSALYDLSQNSPYVFASPMGPLPAAAGTALMPRFVFFGPHASEESWRLALLAGFDHRDLRASRALVALAARLSGDLATGHALNLTIFPLVDVLGQVLGAAERGLAEAPWGAGAEPELGILERDARQRGYHGFVRIETGAFGDEQIAIRIRGSYSQAHSQGLELITAEETGAYPVRLVVGETAPGDGPLSVSDDLPLLPFELTLRIPGSWTDAAYQDAVVTLVERFLRRYRAFQAFGQHL
jgi:hypothetical protein